ncbi:MAG TPA: TniQ family protein [Ktedonobacteraceae bacterium]
MEYGALPRRATPRPWEDLASFISRTARHMGYEQPEWVLHPENSAQSIAPQRLAYLSRLADYELLERLLLLDEEVLYSLTLHRFATSLGGRHSTPGQLPLEIGRLQLLDPGFFWPRLETQICPYCLYEEEAYDRLYWRVRTLLICPRHLIYLQHRCPACFKPIPALRSHPFLCPYCRKGDYRSVCEAIHPRDVWLYDTQVLLLEHLAIDYTEWGTPSHSKSLLKALSPRHYFLMLQQFEHLFVRETFASVVLRDLFQDPTLRSLSQRPGERKSAFLFHWLVAEWPKHFFWLLERIASLFPEEVYWGKGWSRWPVPWRELDFFLNPAFSVPDQQQTYSLLTDFFSAYETYFPSRWGTFWPWGLTHTVQHEPERRIPPSPDDARE